MSSPKMPDPSPQFISDSQFDALVDLLGVDSDAEDDEGKKQQRPNNIVNPFDFAENPSRNQDRDDVFNDAKPRVDAAVRAEADLIDLANNSPLWNHVSIQEPLQESTPIKKQMETPLKDKRSPDLASIKAALDLAHREAEELKERCRDLEALLKSRSNELGIDLHHEDKIQDQRMSTDELPENDHDHVDSGDEQQQTTLDIDNISLPRARLLLKFLLKKFSLSIAEVQSEAQRAVHVTAPVASGSKLALNDYHRSVEFVSYIDELVWRRSRLGCKYNDAHGEDNISALKERIDLWERVIRSRPLKR